MASITYNGVSMPYPLHTQFQTSAEYDDSNTNRMYTKFDVTAQWLINTNYADSIIGGLAGQGPATIIKAVRQRLLTPRKLLTVTSSGINLIPAAQGGNTGTVDAKNGPHPQYCNINAMTDTLFLLNYRIVAHYWENNTLADPNTNQGSDQVINNRWTENVYIDDRQFTRRTRSGKFTIRSDNTQGLTPEQIAQGGLEGPIAAGRKLFAAISVPNGFRRISSEYGISEDGLTLSFNFVDQEEYILPPEGAHKASGRYRETTTHNGGMREGFVEVTLEGDKTADRSTLLETAISICVNKLRSEGAQLNGIQFSKMDRMTIDEMLYENKVTVSMTALMYANIPSKTRNAQNNGAQERGPLQAAVIERNLALPLGATQTPPTYRPYGTSNYILQAAAYYDPSLAKTLIKATDGQLDKGKQPGQEGV